ncbi:MAG: hypothetical protein GY679_01250 [Mycoplasma sp.]|nr:hypothetical protein [Mycoplasma sp.]
MICKYCGKFILSFSEACGDCLKEKIEYEQKQKNLENIVKVFKMIWLCEDTGSLRHLEGYGYLAYDIFGWGKIQKAIEKLKKGKKLDLRLTNIIQCEMFFYVYKNYGLIVRRKEDPPFESDEDKYIRTRKRIREQLNKRR